MKILFPRLRTVLKKSCRKFWRDGRVPRLFASLYTLSFCAAPFRKNLFVCILRFEFIPRYLFSRNFGNARFLSPRPTDRSHNFPPILMEHQRGHVSSTFPLSALINPRPTPRIFRSSRVSSPDFWLEIRAAAGKTRKRGAKPGEIGSREGVVPSSRICRRTIRHEILDYLSVTR